jgi:hypothetical protein
MQELSLRDQEALVKLLSRHYFRPYEREAERPLVKKRVVEEILVREPHVDHRDVDAGPSRVAILSVVGAAVLLVPVGIRYGWGASLGLGVLIAALGFLALRRFREIRTEEVKTIHTVPRSVEKEISVPSDEPVYETVRSKTRVVGIGRGRLKSRGIRTPYGVLVAGPDGLTSPVQLTLPVLNDVEPIFDADRALGQEMGSIPWVLEGAKKTFPTTEPSAYRDAVPLYSLETRIRDYFELVTTSFRSIRPIPVDLNVLTETSLMSHLEPVDRALDPPAWATELLRLLDYQADHLLEEFATKWVDRWAWIHLVLFKARTVALCEELAPECLALGNRTTYKGFHFYCPECNRPTAELLLQRDYSVQAPSPGQAVTFSPSTRCVRRPNEDVWRCLACERETTAPIPIHRMLDELILPVYDRLMEEHKVERLKAHAKARSDELSLQNQREAELEKTRSEGLTQLYALSEELERFRAEIAGEYEAIDSMLPILTAYSLHQEATVMQIRDFSRRVNDETKARTEKLLEGMDKIELREMKTLDEKMQKSSRALRIEDEARDQVQRSILEGVGRLETVTRQGFAEQIAVTRDLGAKVERGFADQVAATKEVGTKVEQGFSEQVAATREVGVKLETGFKDQAQEIREVGTKVENVGGAVRQQTALQAAVARKSGIDLHDAAWYRPDKIIPDLLHDAIGMVSGRATRETEAEKLKN